MGMQARVSFASSSYRRDRIRKTSAGVGVAFAALLLAATAARAQCAYTGVVPVPGNPAEITMGMGSTLSGAIGSAVGTANTAFLAQTTAFIASPNSSQSDQNAAGAWIRTIGGRTEVTSNGAGISTWTVLPGVTGTVACNSTTRSDYAGVQAGFDIGRLSIGNSDTNVHFGLTGGYLYSNNKTTAGIDLVKGRFDVPFVGVYAALVSGSGFYIDAQVRRDFYRINVSDSAIALNQGINADGWAVTSSIGYVFNVGSYIVEPSAGVVYARTSVDPLRFAATAPGFVPMPGTLNIADIETLLGRVGLRVATSATLGALAVQPFVAASVWHEFAGNIDARYRTQCPPAPAPSCFDIVGVGRTNFTVASATDRVGTFGQFSAGFAATLPQTPWLGYLRLDFRVGDNIQGFGVNGGLRYQFTPSPS